MSAIKANAAMFQDAYHYALAAAGDQTSSFYFEGPRSREGITRRQYLARACDRLESMGFAVKCPPTLHEARTFADNIDGLARVYGISAWRGECLCKTCGQDHPTSDHDYEAREAARKLG